MAIEIVIPTRFVIETWWMAPFAQGALLALMAVAGWLTFIECRELDGDGLIRSMGWACFGAILFPFTLFTEGAILVKYSRLKRRLKDQGLWTELVERELEAEL